MLGLVSCAVGSNGWRGSCAWGCQSLCVSGDVFLALSPALTSVSSSGFWRWQWCMEIAQCGAN